jgi:hypothetical protein
VLPYATRFSALARESYVPASWLFTVVIIIPASGNSSRAALYHTVQGQRLPRDEVPITRAKSRRPQRRGLRYAVNPSFGLTVGS